VESQDFAAAFFHALLGVSIKRLRVVELNRPLRQRRRTFMLSRETLDEYRRMTPGQRLRLTLDMIDANVPCLSQGTPEIVARRFELIQRDNDLRNANILRALRRARNHHEGD
jgi:hypothetical protein